MFLIFIGYSLLTEILGFVFGVFLRINNHFIYNSWKLLNQFFYIFFFLSKLKSPFKRIFLKVILVLLGVYALIEISFFTNFLTHPLINYSIIGRFVMVLSVLMYFHEVLKSDEVLKLRNSMFYWIGLGVLLYNIGFIPVYVIAELISFGAAFRIITLVLNLIMVSCFITGFIVSKKEFNN